MKIKEWGKHWFQKLFQKQMKQMTRFCMSKRVSEWDEEERKKEG